MRISDLRACTLAGALLAAGGSAGAAEPRYGVCRQQITDYVQQTLGQTLDRIEISSYAERSRVFMPGSALVFVRECDGFHAFEIYGTESVCEHLPHYGSGGSYVRYSGAYEGCKGKP